MSLYGALLSGVSGLRSQSQSLGMISDNLSNVNTPGYTRQRLRLDPENGFIKSVDVAPGLRTAKEKSPHPLLCLREPT